MAKEWTTLYPSYTNHNSENADFNFFSTAYFEDISHSPLGTEFKVYKQRPIQTEYEDNGILSRGVFQQVTPDNAESSKKRQLLCPIGTIQSGDYIFHNNEFWIVVGLVDNNGFYEKAVLYYCNWMLKIECPQLDDGIVSYPIYIQNAVQYNSGVTNASNIVIGSNQHLIYIQCNEETISINRDTRLLIDKDDKTPNVFKITRIDPITFNFGNKGVITWMVSECQTEFGNDNIEEKYADNRETYATPLIPYDHHITDNNKTRLGKWV